MRAVQVQGDADNHQIVYRDDLPVPVPKGNEVLVKVHAAGITADEVTWPELYATASRIPGHDISGDISAVGPEYAGPLKVGDGVYAMLHADRGEGQAEFVVAQADEVALKPTSLSFAEAAAIPIPVLTAWEAIFEHAKLKQGARILVTGASGSVGSFLVQLAHKLKGAEVVGLVSARKASYVQALGVKEVVDYAAADWWKQVGQVDAVFDTVGEKIIDKTWHIVADDGAIVTVGDPAPKWGFGRGRPDELSWKPNVKWVHFVVSPSAVVLNEASKLIDDGTIKVLPVKTFPIEQAKEAWGLSGQRGKDGKIVIECISA